MLAPAYTAAWLSGIFTNGKEIAEALAGADFERNAARFPQLFANPHMLLKAADT